MQLSEKDLPDLAGWQVVKRARNLVSAGSVVDSSIQVGDDGQCYIKGQVIEGRRRYVSALTITSLIEAENHCSCPASRRDGQICEHSVAVALAALSKKHATHVKKDSQQANNQEAADTSGLPFPLFPTPLFDSHLIGERAVFPFHFSKITQSSTSNFHNEVFLAVQNLGITESGSAELNRSDFFTLLSVFKGNIWPTNSIAGTKCKSPDVRVSSMPARIPLILSENTENPNIISLELADSKGAVILCDGLHCWILREDDHLWIPTNLGSMNQACRSRLKSLFNALPDIARIEVESSWLRREIGNLIDLFHMECSGELSELIQVTPGSPEVSIHVEGSLKQLKLILTFNYDPGEQLNPALVSSVLKSFNVDDWNQLKAANQENAEVHAGKLTGEQAILDFYAGRLERIVSAGEWNVEIGSRFAEVTRNIEKVRPRVLPLSEGADWLSFDLKFSSDNGHIIPENEMRRLLATGSSKARLPGGGHAAFDRSEIGGLFDSLGEADTEQGINPSSGQRARSIHRLFYEAYIGEKYSSGSHSSISQPVVSPAATFSGELRDYQSNGLNWLYSRSSRDYGAILADEMGLGKTIQILALISLMQDAEACAEKNLADCNIPTPCMVVCPTSLILNWKQEIIRFLPTKSTLILHGPRRSMNFGKISQFDIVITSYGALTRDLSSYPEITFQLLIADEASCLKNSKTRAAKSLAKVSSRSRIALSGTPMENSLKDLWSIMNFVNPGYLGTKDSFSARYGSASSSEMGQLKQKVSPFMLRRTKAEVASELPSKIERVIYCELTEQQRSDYEQLIQFTRNSFKNIHKSLSDSEERMQVLLVLLRLRQVCCDSRLLRGLSSRGQLPQGKIATLFNDPDGAFSSTDALANNPSSKLNALDPLLGQIIAKGSHVLIFSQFVSMLGLIRKHLDSKGIKYCYLDGSQSPEQRHQQVSAFQDTQSDIPIFLMSLKAGGYGLTLTKADTVIHFDPWWNPAVEAQATDRAHRIGQSRTVTSYKFIIEGSVEQKILELQNRKKRIADVLLDDECPLMDSLQGEDIEFILS